MLAFDTETHLITSTVKTPPLVCVSVARPDKTTFLLDKSEGCDFIEKAMDMEQLIIGHNTAFDFAVLAAYRPEMYPKIFLHFRRNLVRDTMIREQLLDIAIGRHQAGGNTLIFRGGQWVKTDYSLAGSEKVPGSTGLVGRYLGKDRSGEKALDSWRTRYSELDGLPLVSWPSEAINYAKSDAEDTLGVYLKQPKDVVNEQEQVFAAFCLFLISKEGLKVDVPAVFTLEKQTLEEYAVVQEKLKAAGFYKIGGTKKEPKLTKDMAVIKSRVEKAYAEQGSDTPKTDKDNIRTDADTLQESGDPLLAELGGLGPVSTILKTFIPVLKRGSSIHSNIRPLVNSGRPSASDPNIFNLPRSGGVRECFIPSPGFLFCSVDYDCAELRSLAQVCLWLFGKSTMAEFFQREPNGDPHLELAASMIGITSEEAKARKKAGDPEMKGLRQLAKSLNFGFPGGMGPRRFVVAARVQYGIRLTVEEATSRRQQWFEKWPEMKTYLDYIGVKVGFDENARFMQLRPEKHIPHRLRGGLGFSEAANTYFQGLTADGAKDALTCVSEKCYTDRTSVLYGSRPVVFLYDEIICEVPEGCASDAATELADTMRRSMQKWLPDVPVTCSPALMKKWYKGAEPVYLNNKLVPWEPK